MAFTACQPIGEEQRWLESIGYRGDLATEKL